MSSKDPDVMASAPSYDFVRIISPRVFADELGFSLEIQSDRTLWRLQPGLRFLEERLVHSVRGAIRGLYYQLGRPQANLVRVVDGSIFFVSVDMRRSSPEFGVATCLDLNETGREAVWVPGGYACGFMSISQGSKVLIKASERDDAAYARTLLWNDPALGIEWPIIEGIRVSGRALLGKPLSETEYFE